MSADAPGRLIPPAFDSGYPEAVIGSVAIAVFFWLRYNSWTEAEAGYGAMGRPRQFTTWARFMSSAAVYTLLMESVYQMLLTAPETLLFLAGKGWPAIEPFAMNQPGDAFPLWVAVFLLGISPYLPVLRRAEETIRRWLHQRAFIPSEAMALVSHLLIHPEFFKPDDQAAREVIERYGRDVPGGWESVEAGDRLAGQLFRLVYLRERFERWRLQPQAARFVWQIESEYQAFQEQFRKLNQDVKTYAQYGYAGNGDPDSTDPGPSLRKLKDHTMRRIDKTLNRACEIVVRGILSTERTHSGRTAVLNYFGLYPTSYGGVPVMWDIVFKTGIIVLIVATLTGTGWAFGHLLFIDRLPLPIAKVLNWSVIFTLITVISIFNAAVVHLGLVNRRRYDTGNKAAIPGHHMFAYLGIGSFTGYLCGLLVIFLIIAISSVSRLSMFQSLVIALPWPLMSAVTSGFVVYYLVGSTVVRHRFRNIFVQGLVSGAASLVSCLWAFDSIPYEWGNTPAYVVYFVTTGMCVGGAVGFYFPMAYGNRVAEMHSDSA